MTGLGTLTVWVRSYAVTEYKFKVPVPQFQLHSSWTFLSCFTGTRVPIFSSLPGVEGNFTEVGPESTHSRIPKEGEPYHGPPELESVLWNSGEGIIPDPDVWIEEVGRNLEPPTREEKTDVPWGRKRGTSVLMELRHKGFRIEGRMVQRFSRVKTGTLDGVVCEVSLSTEVLVERVWTTLQRKYEHKQVGSVKGTKLI